MNTALKSDQKIFRRNVELTYDHHKSYSFYYEENPVVTSLFVVLSAMFPAGEMFFIESIRNVRNQIKDEKLLEDIKAFIAQEAFHSREHKTLNNHLIHSNYPEVVEIEAKTKARLDKLRQLSADSLIKAKTTQESRNLWEWHALEELEHKSVAFDVLNAIGGNSSKNRKVALARVAKLITPIIFKYWIKILKRKDINFTLKQLKDGIYLGFGGINRVGILSKAFVDMLDVRAENFDPLNMQTEQLEAEFREKLFGQAGFLRDYLS